MFETWMSIVGLSMGVSSIPQIVRILKRKKSNDVSLWLWLIVLHGQFWWFVYGVYLNDICLKITNLTCFVVNLILITLVVKYRTKRGKYERAHLDP